MTRPVRTPLLLALSILALSTTPLAAYAQSKAGASSVEALRQGFLNPPDAAKPMVRWWWFGPAVVKPEILRELQQMKADGIGGAELAFVYPVVLDDPAKGLKNLPFLSPEMLDAVRYAQTEGRRLGLRIDVTLCTGWPYGGNNTPLSEAAGRLRTLEVSVPANATSVTAPALGEGESFISAAIADGRAVPEQPAGRGRDAAPKPVDWDVASAQPLTLASTIKVAPSSVARVALFFVAGHTKQQVKRASVDADGYVLDPFSHQAVATHLKKVGEPLLSAFEAAPPYAIFSDSLEAYGADWTPNLPAEFKKRRGYDLLPHMPELVAGGSPAADKVRHDWGVTLTELVNENYLVQINDWAKAHHTRFRSQTYGEPAVNFSSENLVDLAEGEGPQWRAFSTLRWATSANHVFDHDVTSGETFTWLHSPVFRATPLDMKAEADIDFITGENQLIFHGWPYSAPDHEVPEPGWSLYAAGVFNDHNPWHPVMPAVTNYIARVSWLLRQGKPANQVAILLPTDDAWASFYPSKVSVTAAMQKLISPALMSAILSAGYNPDFIDAAAIDTVGLGAHQVLIIPATDRIPLATLRRIDDFTAKGGKVIAVEKLPSLDAEGKPLSNAAQQTRAIALIRTTEQLGQALHNAVVPDLELLPGQELSPSALANLGFIRRKLADADVYFVANTSNEPMHVRATFATAHAFGEQIDPDSGEGMETSKTANGRGAADIQLAPYESRVLLFTDTKAKISTKEESYKPLADLSSDWHVAFDGMEKSATEHTLTDWTANPETLHYSGGVLYSKDVTLNALPQAPVFLEVEGGTALPGAPNSPPEHAALGTDGLPNPLVTHPGPGTHAFFDAPIREAALVTVNGKSAGALWHPPYRLDVTKLLKSGVNHIEIRVYNTALNAWSALPPHDYKPLIAKYGDRFQMQDLDKVKPISSGILGTIHLVTQDGQ
jgi:hypothetical protein